MASSAQTVDQARGIDNVVIAGNRRSVRDAKTAGYSTISDQARERYADAGLAGKQDIQQTAQNEREQLEQQQYQTFENSRPGQLSRNALAGTIRGTRRIGATTGVTNTASFVASRVKVTTANAWITGWTVFFYLFVQLPFAIISTAGLGIGAYIYSYVNALRNENGGFDLVLRGIEILIGNFDTAVRTYMKYRYGFEIDPISLFFIPFILLFALGVLQLLISWFMYSLLGIKSLSGKSGGLKILLFILAGIGTVIPVLNLFPLIITWTAVVWIRPK